MLFGIGWCVLRTSRAAHATTDAADARALEESLDAADEALWARFTTWMHANAKPWVLWTFHERHNNHRGVLQVFVSRNHRASPFWTMLGWIAENGPGSYGLFYVNDDEDGVDHTPRGRSIKEDYDNVFRVHRIMNGKVEELDDPFFGPIVPSLEPEHPYNRDDPADASAS